VLPGLDKKLFGRKSGRIRAVRSKRCAVAQLFDHFVGLTSVGGTATKQLELLHQLSMSLNSVMGLTGCCAPGVRQVLRPVRLLAFERRSMGHPKLFGVAVAISSEAANRARSSNN